MALLVPIIVVAGLLSAQWMEEGDGKEGIHSGRRDSTRSSIRGIPSVTLQNTRGILDVVQRARHDILDSHQVSSFLHTDAANVTNLGPLDTGTAGQAEPVSAPSPESVPSDGGEVKAQGAAVQVVASPAAAALPPSPGTPTESAYVAPESPEAIICGVWGDLCGKALRVAQCESTDYYAPFDGYHVGGFQLATVHATRFMARGWDYWVDGDDIYANSVVAFELYQEQGFALWPYCRWA